VSKLFAAPLVKDPEVKRLSDAVTSMASSIAANYVSKQDLTLPKVTNQIAAEVSKSMRGSSENAAVLDGKNERATADIIRRVLANSGTLPAVQINSPYLFVAGGSKTNVWIGAGGIGGMYNSIPTWGITSDTGGFFFGRQDMPNRQITFDPVLGELVLGSDIRLLSMSGETIADFVTRLGDEKYTDEKLSAAMAAGVNNIIATASNSNYKLQVTDNSLVAMHKSATYNGYATGDGLTGLIINANGIAMGFNDKTDDGAWKNAVYIGATGSFVFGHTTGKQVLWDADAGELVLGSMVRLSSAGGRTLAELLIDVDTPDYTKDNLESDIAAGVKSLVAGSTGDYMLNVDATRGLALFQHRLAEYEGLSSGYTGTYRTMLGITANGIGAGYNDKTTGAFVNVFSIDATTGNAAFKGKVTATSGSFVGSIEAESGTFTGGVNIKDEGALYSGQTAFNTGTGFWLSGGTTPQMSVGSADSGFSWDGEEFRINGVLSGDIIAGAAGGATALSGLDLKLNKASDDILSGQIKFAQQGAFKVTTGTVTVDAEGNVSGSGSGVLFTSKGIIGWNGETQKATFAIGSDGNAVFAGRLDAATGTFAGSVTATTFIANGSARFRGRTDAGVSVSINGNSYGVVATSISEVAAATIAADAVRVGVVGLANVATGAGTNVGVAGVSTLSGGIGGYFSGAAYGAVFNGSTYGFVSQGNGRVEGDLEVTGTLSATVNVAWAGISGKPSTYPPETHTHSEYLTSMPSHTHTSTEDLPDSTVLFGSSGTPGPTGDPDGYVTLRTAGDYTLIKIPYWNV
jgi:hypothetical protein